MSDRLDELGSDIDVVLVTFTDPASLAAYNDRHRLQFPVVLDPDRAAYRAFGLGRGQLMRIYGWRAARRYLQLFRAQGFGGLRRPTEDTQQLGGDFVVAPDGTLAYGYWGEGPDDRPATDDLIAAAEAASGRRGNA